MALVVASQEIVRQATAARLAWAGRYSVGLYRNDLDPGHTTALTAFQPAVFSGYVGLRVISQWSPPEWDGTRATITGPSIVWTHDGGPVPGLVWGYYVVTDTGEYAWGERLDPPVWVTAPNGTYRVQPRFTFRSEF